MITTLSYISDKIVNPSSIDDFAEAFRCIDQMHAPHYEDIRVLLKQLFDERQWKQRQFCEKTHLTRTTYNKIISPSKKQLREKWELKTIMAIIAGLAVPRHIALRILAASACPMYPNTFKEHCAYDFLIDKFEGRQFADWNEFLVSVELEKIVADR